MKIRLLFITICALLLSACRLEVYAVGGSVYIDPSQRGSNCPPSSSLADICTEYKASDYDPSKGVTVYATPRAGREITGWSLSSCGTESSCTVPAHLITGGYVLKVFFGSQNAMEMTWDVQTDDYGRYALGFSSTSYPGLYSDFSIDWGDGTMSTNIQNFAVKVYDKPGLKKIKIYGLVKGTSFCPTRGNQGEVVSIDHWGDNQWRLLDFMFANCKKPIAINASDTPDFRRVYSARSMFENYEVPSDQAVDISEWNFGSIPDMTTMFRGAKSYPKGMSSLNTGSLTKASYMFENAWNLTQNINSWNMSKVTNMEGMFKRSHINPDISNWNTRSVTTMEAMFLYAQSFNQNIGNWDTRSVVNMSGMFKSASSFNQNIGNWDIGNVKFLYSFLGAASSFSTENYDSLLNGWAMQINGDNVQFDTTLRVDSQHSSAAINAKAMLVNERDWTIEDKGCSDC